MKKTIMSIGLILSASVFASAWAYSASDVDKYSVHFDLTQAPQLKNQPFQIHISQCRFDATNFDCEKIVDSDRVINVVPGQIDVSIPIESRDIRTLIDSITVGQDQNNEIFWKTSVPDHDLQNGDALIFVAHANGDVTEIHGEDYFKQQ